MLSDLSYCVPLRGRVYDLGTLNLPGGSSAGVRQMFYSGALSVGQGSETNYHTVSIPDLPDAPLKAPHYILDVVARLEGLAVGHALVQTPKMPTCAEVAMYPYAPLSDSEAQ